MALQFVPVAFILSIVSFSELILGKRFSPTDLDSIKPTKINECQRCKVLTDSFNYWLEKTARGKFEGGDTAWEEAKLKSYARSEIRLVEVQEGLCSELRKHQDHCYTLSEEAEQLLEKWWFHEDPNTADLYTWLCVDTLQYCCPAYHYGETCTLCPLDKNNNICSGNGKCDGEGTRKGNGTCICKRGYAGKYCDECGKNYYSMDTTCLPCHKSCDGCSGEGPSSCINCNTGWELQSSSCVDIDECVFTPVCGQSRYCLNEEGSYKCKTCDTSCRTCVGEGPANCSSCHPSNVHWSGMCLNDTQKNTALLRGLLKAAMYIALFVVPIVIVRTYRTFTTLILILFAMSFIYLDLYFNVFKVFN